MPEQIISSALAGGGKQSYYVLESVDWKGKSIVEINADKLPTPKTIDDLQNNYLIFEGKGLGVMFK